MIHKALRRLAYNAHTFARHLHIWADVKCSEHDWDARIGYWPEDEGSEE